ncbi:MAG: hypothetical protein P0Y53_09345 [Candidatus Pseudobacter hemicellulosilyticus]|uniref:Uncharacterized protein n=1 Tax=Candidatus Pseudobacter hemicellulosilyticus TaxID=3121375 RepID=A0AAJ5WT14_9BACT|nr:MAG: hypothetical protein P0Y53_09345 [Pseudobacter sp.]
MTIDCFHAAELPVQQLSTVAQSVVDYRYSQEAVVRAFAFIAPSVGAAFRHRSIDATYRYHSFSTANFAPPAPGEKQL